jgi:hypothetical protein
MQVKLWDSVCHSYSKSDEENTHDVQARISRNEKGVSQPGIRRPEQRDPTAPINFESIRRGHRRTAGQKFGSSKHGGCCAGQLK